MIDQTWQEKAKSAIESLHIPGEIIFSEDISPLITFEALIGTDTMLLLSEKFLEIGIKEHIVLTNLQRQYLR